MFPWHEFDTVLFERGVSLSKESDNLWRYQSAQENMYESIPAAVQGKLNLRPIVVIGPCGDLRIKAVLPSTQGRLLNIYRSELMMKIPRSSLFLMGAVLYHCKALAQWYTDQCSSYSSFPHKPDANRVVIGGVEEPYFEFESLITAIVRGYDTLRYALWNKWGDKSGCPSSFTRALKRCKALPPGLQHRLQVSNDKFLSKAKEYRDCVQHYIDFGSTSWAMMELLHDSVWSIIVRVPDNPEARSRDRFQFHQNVDALTLGWELATEFFAVVDNLLGSGCLSTIKSERS